MNEPLPIGINIDGVLDHDGLPDPGVAERFARVAASGAFDYIEKNLVPGEDFAPYRDAVQRHGVPLGVLGGIFCAGRDEARMHAALGLAGELGAALFNCQLFARHADGHALSDDEVADWCSDALEHGARAGCLPSFEVHVDMWNEDCRRVDALAERLARRGLPMRVTLDHAHILYKIGNAQELAVAGIADAVARGELVLEPRSPRAVYTRWLHAGWVVHAHTRSVAPGGPANAWARRGDGRPGRAIQYPFVRPQPGAWHSPWRAGALAMWKEAVEQLLAWRAAHPDRAPQRISCEFIPFADCGGGARYPIFEQNLACAAWLRERWSATPGIA